MTQLITVDDLATDTDEVLDDSLVELFHAHEVAMAVGDTQAKAETHWAILQILAEQSRRLDVWIAEHLEEPA